MTKRPCWEDCEVGQVLRPLIEQGPQGANIIFLRKGSPAETRLAFVEAGKAHCLAACGGCPLTDRLS